FVCDDDGIFVIGWSEGCKTRARNLDSAGAGMGSARSRGHFRERRHWSWRNRNRVQGSARSMMPPFARPMWSSVTEDLWLIDWSQTAEKACWAKRYIAASVEEGATREEVRAFGRLAPVATQDAAGSPHQPARTRHLLKVRPQEEPPGAVSFC